MGLIVLPMLSSYVAASTGSMVVVHLGALHWLSAVLAASASTCMSGCVALVLFQLVCTRL